MQNEYGYLIHSQGVWKDHKYIAKKKIDGKWRYIYENAKYRKEIAKNSHGITVEKDNYTDENGYYKNVNLKFNNGESKEDTWSDRLGIERRNKTYSDGEHVNTISLYDTSNRKLQANDWDDTGLNKKVGPLSVSYAEDGAQYTLDLNYGKKKISEIKEKTEASKKKVSNVLSNIGGKKAEKPQPRQVNKVSGTGSVKKRSAT